MKVLQICLVLFFLTACSTEWKVKKVLEKYVDAEFAKQQEASVVRLKKNNFKIILISCEKNKCFLTYTVSYETYKSNQIMFSTKVWKIAELNKLDGGWKVVSVINTNTEHSGKKDLFLGN